MGDMDQKRRDRIPGGLGDHNIDQDFDQKELAKGMEHEMEHTSDPSLAKEITKDHVLPLSGPESPKDTRDPHYYEHLDTAEKLNPNKPKEQKLSTSDVFKIFST